jgi:PHP family Zn ribbon phosphoesterase
MNQRYSYLPKKTKRYCTHCKTVTKWTYDKHLFHSRCDECGGEKSRRLPPKLKEIDEEEE